MPSRTSETLGDFVRRIRREKNLSLTDVSAKSARSGKRIAASYINRIENKPKLKPSPNSLSALANGLGVPVEELFARAIGVLPTGGSNDEFELLARFRKLPPERRADVLMIVDIWYSQVAITCGDPP
jgi:transcriptional regulator with XRE-family HTH domain